MKIGVLTVLMSGDPLEKVLDFLAESGVEAVELGTGNYPGGAHCDPDKLLESDKARKDLLKAVEKRGHCTTSARLPVYFGLPRRTGM